MISRSEVLAIAGRYVNGERDQTHGNPAITFDRIAGLWSVYLGVTVTPADVCAMMILFKTGRIMGNKQHVDSWIDVAGYAACGAEVADAKEA